MSLRPISSYARELRPHLPASVFDPVPARLGWLALHLVVVVAGMFAIAALADGGVGSWLLMAAVSVPVGLSFAGMAFVAHETLHGAVVRPMWARRLVGWVAFAPFLISPRHWVAWHNRLHHGHTTIAGIDPDTYPTLEHYEKDLVARVADKLSFGGRRWLGMVTLLIGLVVQSTEVLVGSGPRAKYMSPRQHRLALLETLAALAVWVGLGVWLGLPVFLFGWLLPLTIGSIVVMAHIVTNHSLSPLTDVNDPLVNSLTVTVPRWFSIYTLQFGLHAEHHLFPTISGRHAGHVRDLLVARWPDRYRSMPLSGALRRMFTTGRIYKNATTLIDPTSGVESSTLPAIGATRAPATPQRRPAAVPA